MATSTARNTEYLQGPRMYPKSMLNDSNLMRPRDIRRPTHEVENLSFIRRVSTDAEILSRKTSPSILSYVSDQCDLYSRFGERFKLDKPIEEATRTQESRVLNMPSVLRLLFIRGRVQAAAFDCFIQLCAHRVCSLKALEHPISWDPISWDYEDMLTASFSTGTIRELLLCFEQFGDNWELIKKLWEVEDYLGPERYNAPWFWLVVMIRRSFTGFVEHMCQDLHKIGQLCASDHRKLDFFRGQVPAKEYWYADINAFKADKWRGSGTFAFWLPEYVDSAVLQLSPNEAAQRISAVFYDEVENMEKHYRLFFDIPYADMYRSDLKYPLQDYCMLRNANTPIPYTQVPRSESAPPHQQLPTGNDGRGIDHKAIVIKNIPKGLKQAELEIIVKGVGVDPWALNYLCSAPSRVSTTGVKKKNFLGIAFANFNSAEKAREAISKLNGFPIQDRLLDVEYKKFKNISQQGSK